MTRGKKADSAMPSNHRIAKMPPKFLVAAVSNVSEPKQNIKIGRTRAGPYFLPSIAIGGANKTNGMKNIPTIWLYCPGEKFKSIIEVKGNSGLAES